MSNNDIVLTKSRAEIWEHDDVAKKKRDGSISAISQPIRRVGKTHRGLAERKQRSTVKIWPRLCVLNINHSLLGHFLLHFGFSHFHFDLHIKFSGCLRILFNLIKLCEAKEAVSIHDRKQWCLNSFHKEMNVAVYPDLSFYLGEYNVLTTY